MIGMVLKSSLILALLGAIDSLLTSLVADTLTHTFHDSDKEMVGQVSHPDVSFFVVGIAFPPQKIYPLRQILVYFVSGQEVLRWDMAPVSCESFGNSPTFQVRTMLHEWHLLSIDPLLCWLHRASATQSLVCLVALLQQGPR